jgi:hypothetical protein
VKRLAVDGVAWQRADGELARLAQQRTVRPRINPVAELDHGSRRGRRVQVHAGHSGEIP